MEYSDQKIVVGGSELVSFGKRAVDVPAKIDTGADGSSVWASNIRINKKDVLVFSLFGEGSPYYNGKIFKRKDYKVAVVRSATGEEQVRYRTHLVIRLAGKKIRVLFNLSDRSRNNFPVLIGKRTLKGRFIVDASKAAVQYPKNPRTLGLVKELKKNPYEFDQKYGKNRMSKGD